jgi:hypothetical protein
VGPPDARELEAFFDDAVYDRIPSYQRPKIHAILAAAVALLLVATLIGVPRGARLRRIAGEPRGGMPRAARILALVVASLERCFLVGLGAGLTAVDPYALLGAIPLWLRALSMIPLLALPLSLVLLHFWLRSFATHTWTAFEHLHSLAVTLAAGFFGVFVWYRNLFGVTR